VPESNRLDSDRNLVGYVLYRVGIGSDRDQIEIVSGRIGIGS
jgi:hypothetical protein